jgi:hypothetical protein
MVFKSIANLWVAFEWPVEPLDANYSGIALLPAPENPDGFFK